MKNYEYSKRFYQNFRKFIVWYMDMTYNIEATGVENIPTDSNYLMVGNHLNILDAALIAKYDPSNLRFMVDNKLYKTHSGNYFFKKCGTFGIDPNNSDVKAVREAYNILKEYSVVIFPEGRTHKLEEEVPFKPGFSGIARMSNVPVVPFGINGTYERHSDLQINFGEPINLKELDVKKSEYDRYIENEVRKLQMIKH